MVSIIGQKLGVTNFFLPSGNSVCATVIFLSPTMICGKYMKDNNLIKVKLSFGHSYRSRLNKSCCGEFKYVSFAGSVIYELHNILSEDDCFSVGDSFNLNVFKKGDIVHVTSRSKGKGFSGVVKRHNFSCQNMSHGNSLSHRAPGSIGQCQSPGKVFKGKKMAGHLGFSFTTIRNLKILFIDFKYNLLVVLGSIPGHINCFVKLRKVFVK